MNRARAHSINLSAARGIERIFLEFEKIIIKFKLKTTSLCYKAVTWHNLHLTLGVFLWVNFGNHCAAPITRDPIADSPDEMTTIVLSSAERECGFHFFYILINQFQSGSFYFSPRLQFEWIPAKFSIRINPSSAKSKPNF